MEFSKKELERYSRHIILPGFNIEGQKKLKSSKVLVIGAGGLGAPLLQYLAAAGVGTIGIVDMDVVEDHNLHRQVLFNTKDIGRPKVEVASERLKALEPGLEIRTYQEKLSSANALEIFKEYDIVADGTDNFPTRYLVNDASVITGIPNVYASIFQYEGQVSVFNHEEGNGTRGPNYRDLFPTPPPPGSVPSCSEGGVLGVLAGMVGSMQANEVIKVLTGIGDPLSGRLFILNSLTFRTRTVKVQKDPNSPRIEELIDYEDFCGIRVEEDDPSDPLVKRISPVELKRRMDEADPPFILDVREAYEYEIVNIGGELIPLDQLKDELDKIPRDREIVVHCRKGPRSQKAVRWIQEELGLEDVYELEGGILGWIDQVRPDLPRY